MEKIWIYIFCSNERLFPVKKSFEWNCQIDFGEIIKSIHHWIQIHRNLIQLFVKWWFPPEIWQFLILFKIKKKSLRSSIGKIDKNLTSLTIFVNGNFYHWKHPRNEFKFYQSESKNRFETFYLKNDPYLSSKVVLFKLFIDHNSYKFRIISLTNSWLETIKDEYFTLFAANTVLFWFIYFHSSRKVFSLMIMKADSSNKLP